MHLVPQKTFWNCILNFFRLWMKTKLKVFCFYEHELIGLLKPRIMFFKELCLYLPSKIVLMYEYVPKYTNIS
jgi:hypothetical protein